ncbi:MAG: arylamine N-acetyltransferase [Proteobacteria bacterium]|nr:arylamine N-acetyltransferase [Pseudomonadota bacterium]
MNLEAYLARIGLDRPPPPTLAGLRMVHRAHLLAIPYENLDVQLGRPLTTAPEEAFEKIVSRGRGGWCYEMNGLLGWALGELGFHVTRATGAVVRSLKGEAAEGNHLVLRVELPEGIYLADVGFGDGPRDPIPVSVGAFESAGFVFSLSRVDDAWWRFSNDPRGGAPNFDFNLAPADEALLSDRCIMLQTSEQSPFVQNLVAQRHTADGIAILRGRVLRRLTPAATDECEIADAGELIRTLSDVFGLDVPEVATLWPRIVARHDEVLAQKRAQR